MAADLQALRRVTLPLLLLALGGCANIVAACDGSLYDPVTGGAVSLSAGGATLAVGAIGEASDATGVGGEQTRDAAIDSGAVYLY